MAEKQEEAQSPSQREITRVQQWATRWSNAGGVTSREMRGMDVRGKGEEEAVREGQDTSVRLGKSRPRGWP